MLNSGEVPNIFGADEKAELCEKMRVVSCETEVIILDNTFVYTVAIQ